MDESTAHYLRVMHEMMHNNQSQYLYKRGGVYYFYRRVPKDLSHLYNKDRFSISLKTKHKKAARVAADKIAAELDLFWSSKRLESHSLIAHTITTQTSTSAIDSPKLSEATINYLSLKGEGKGKKFASDTNRYIGHICEVDTA